MWKEKERERDINIGVVVWRENILIFEKFFEIHDKMV